MARQQIRRVGLAAAAAVMVLGLSASAALASEVTGSGANVDQNHGKS